MAKVPSIGSPIARLKATHNCAKVSKRIPQKAGLHAENYLACGANVNIQLMG